MRYLILAIVILGLAAPSVQSQPFRGGGKQMKKKLNLTEEQAETLKEIRIKTAKQMIDISSSIKKKGIDLRALMSEDSPDRNAVKSLMTDIGSLKIERKMLMFDARVAVNKVLTPKQQETLNEMRSKRMKSMKHKMQRQMHQRGPGMGDEPVGPPMGFMDDTMEAIDLDSAE